MDKNTMKRPGIAIDAARCTACYACVLACQDEHCGWDTALSKASGQPWMRIAQWERGDSPRHMKAANVPVCCSHCAEPPCMTVATGGAVYKRPDGIVIIDPEKAVGQKAIIHACPIHAVYWNEALQLPQKCTLCADYPGAAPRCVEACPSQALVFGDLADPDSAISRLIARSVISPVEHALEDGGSEALVSGLGHMGDGNVVHLHIPSRFLAGTVAYPKQLDEVVIGAEVQVTDEDSGAVYETQTNWAGDWEIEGLPKNASFTIVIRHDGFKTVVYQGERTDEDHYIGITYLERA